MYEMQSRNNKFRTVQLYARKPYELFKNRMESVQAYFLEGNLSHFDR